MYLQCSTCVCDGVHRSISEGESGSPPHTEFTGEPPEVDSRYVIKPHAEKLRRVSTGCMKLEDEGAALGVERSLHPASGISSEWPTCFSFGRPDLLFLLLLFWEEGEKGKGRTNPSRIFSVLGDFVLYSAVSLTLVKEQRFIRIIYYYYFTLFLLTKKSGSH